MEQIITDELIHYKTGFLDGKNKVLESAKIGSVIKLNDEDGKIESSMWYEKGYYDGFEYFSTLFDEGKSLYLDVEEKNKLIKECFSKRVIESNKEGLEVSVKFKL